jgi:hypothetical protein
MADKKISQFTVLAEATIDAANDVLAIVDATGPETKKASVSAIVGAGALAGVGELKVDNITINGNAITSTDTNGNIDLTPDGTGEVNISKVDIDAGAIDGTIIGGASAAAGTFTTVTSSGNVTITGTGGLGYATGSGGAVTQITSRTTGVTLDKTNGAITLVSAAGTTSWQTFTVTNSTVAATDTVIVSQKSGTDLNMIHVTAVAAGSFNISFATTGGTTTEQPVFNFAVIKAVAA